MGGNSSRPLDAAVLGPMATYQAIADDDEYWNVLFARAVVRDKKGDVKFLPKHMTSIAKTRPNTLRQLVRLGIVKLIDLIHICKLLEPENVNQIEVTMTTIVTMIKYALFESAKQHEIQNLLSTRYDECGVVGETLVTTMTRLVHLKNTTLMPGQDHWCSGASDDGRHDELRKAVLDVLLVVEVRGFPLIDFPRKLFVASTISTLLFYYKSTRPVRLANARMRAKLIQVCLIFMLYNQMTVDEMGITENDYPEVFSPLTDSLNRMCAFMESDTFMVPLMLHYLSVASDNLLDRSPLILIENILHLTDWWRQKQSAKVCLMIIAKMVQLPGILQTSQCMCHNYNSDWMVHMGSWSSVILEVAVRTADQPKARELIPLAVTIGCFMMRQAKTISPTVFKMFFDMLRLGTTDLECQKLVIRTLHFIVSRERFEHPLILVQVLKRHNFLETVHKRDAEFVECTQLLEWIQRQNAELLKVKDKFSTGNLVDLFSAGKHIVPLEPMSNEITGLEFNFESHMKEMTMICAADYLDGSLF